jgi:glycerol-3-phosphate dehydrogenase (NAD+)
MGHSTSAAIVRIGMIETYQFAKFYFSDQKIEIETMLESCVVADFMASSTGARNHRCGIEFAKTGKDIFQIEDEILNVQRTEGHLAAKEIAQFLKKKND